MRRTDLSTHYALGICFFVQITLEYFALFVYQYFKFRRCYEVRELYLLLISISSIYSVIYIMDTSFL